MAEGLARELGKGKLEAYSAGLVATGANPYAIKVMEEIGIDITSQRSKTVEEYKDVKFDFVITLCTEGEDACPVLPGEVKRLHWPFPDPGPSRSGRSGDFRCFPPRPRRSRDKVE